MRRVRLTPEAERTLAHQIEYLTARGAIRPAQDLKNRVETFLLNTIAEMPRMGKRLEQRDLWEGWIPRTRLVVWYTFDDDELTAITFWHTSQDRDRA